VRRDALKEEKRETMKGREALLVRKGKKERRGKVKRRKFLNRNAATGSRSIHRPGQKRKNGCSRGWMVNFMLYRMVDGGSRSILSPRSEAKSGNPAESCPL
jgi:hypothetical protein